MLFAFRPDGVEFLFAMHGVHCGSGQSLDSCAFSTTLLERSLKLVGMGRSMAKLISFHYELRDALGQRLDSSHPGRPVTFIEGEHHLISGLERALRKLRPGDHREVLIPADEAYGRYDESLVISLPRSELDDGECLEIGRSFRIGVHGEESRVFQVIDMTDTSVTLDGNHPLAGQDIIFDIELLQSRPVRDEEAPGGFAPRPGQFLM